MPLGAVTKYFVHFFGISLRLLMPFRNFSGQIILWQRLRKARCPPIGPLYRPTSDLSTPILGRPLKTAHLLRWRARALVAAYLEYAWTHLRWGYPGLQRAALHLSRFERPG